jgi:hypothetical protein
MVDRAMAIDVLRRYAAPTPPRVTIEINPPKAPAKKAKPKAKAKAAKKRKPA